MRPQPGPTAEPDGRPSIGLPVGPLFAIVVAVTLVLSGCTGRSIGTGQQPPGDESTTAEGGLAGRSASNLDNGTGQPSTSANPGPAADADPQTTGTDPGPTNSSEPTEPGSIEVVPPVQTVEEFGWFRRYQADPSQVELVWRDDAGEALSQFESARRRLERSGLEVRLLINGGIYQPGLRPAGLHVEAGRELVAVNLNDGYGNFHLKPNGVFWVDGDTAGVTESEAFVQAARSPRLAVQSGPMLTIDGAIHPAFGPTSRSRNLRSGVGVRPDGTVVFLISTRPVNLHTFAQAFLDSGAPNALYLDGGRPARMVEVVNDDTLTPHIPLAAMLAVVDRPS